MENENQFISEGLALGEMKEIAPKRVTYSVAFKKRVIRDLIANKQRGVDIANKYKLTGNVVSAWKFTYAKGIKKDIDKKRANEMTSEDNSIIAQLKKEYDKKIDSKNEELESLYLEIGRLTIKLRNLESR